MSRDNTCKTCSAYLPSRPNARDGQCRARSPLPVLVGMAQQPSVGAILGGMNGGHAVPVVQGYFPPVHEDIWCRDWRLSTAIEGSVQPAETAA